MINKGVTNKDILSRVEEYNTIISTFMGGVVRVAWAFKDRTVFCWEGPIVAEFRQASKMPVGPGVNPTILIEQVEFHKSWNWLMPVVEKIESLCDDHHGYFGVHISSNGCNIQGTNLWKAMKDCSDYGYVYMTDPNSILETKFDSTYYNVVQFIVWHNAWVASQADKK